MWGDTWWHNRQVEERHLPGPREICWVRYQTAAKMSCIPWTPRNSHRQPDFSEWFLWGALAKRKGARGEEITKGTAIQTQAGENKLSQEEDFRLPKLRESFVSPETYEGKEKLVQMMRLGHKDLFSSELTSVKSESLTVNLISLMTGRAFCVLLAPKWILFVIDIFKEGWFL